ncbi:MAG TPA: hypothetical protein VHB54_20870 [Mucilaginibacter sp.]|nr:hypothetical protein [Mucilaginibacter sp.]
MPQAACMFQRQSTYPFFIASLLLNVAPGNGVFYVAARAVMQDPKAGILSKAAISAKM